MPAHTSRLLEGIQYLTRKNLRRDGCAQLLVFARRTTASFRALRRSHAAGRWDDRLSPRFRMRHASADINILGAGCSIFILILGRASAAHGHAFRKKETDVGRRGAPWAGLRCN